MPLTSSGGVITGLGNSETWCHGLSRNQTWLYQLAQLCGGGVTPTLETLSPWYGWVESGVPTTGANRKHVAGGFEFRNAGVNGNTTRDMRVRFPVDVLGASPLPDVCLLMIPENDIYMRSPPNSDATYGLNYSPGGIKENVAWLVDQCIDNSIDPVLMTPMPHGGVEGIGTRWQDMQDVLKWFGSAMTWISSGETPNSLGVPLIDVYEATHDPAHREYPQNYPTGSIMTVDNVHPSVTGAGVIAQLVKDALLPTVQVGRTFSFPYQIHGEAVTYPTRRRLLPGAVTYPTRRRLKPAPRRDPVPESALADRVLVSVLNE